MMGIVSELVQSPTTLIKALQCGQKGQGEMANYGDYFPFPI